MRLLVIGLDGATFDQLFPRVQAGQMPTLERLLDEGVYGTLASTHPPVTAPAWSSFFTGLNPGMHGVFGFVEFVVGSDGKLKPSLNDLSTVEGYRLWNYLNRQGLLVGLSNVPMTYPPEPVEGFMVSDLMTAGQRKARTYPPTLIDELASNTHLSFDRAVMDGLSVTPEYLEHLIESLGVQEQADLYLLNTYPTDVFITVYAHTDTLQHYFWKYLDPSHSEHEPADTERLSPLLEKFFRRLDAVIASLLNAVAPGTPMLIISDHGFGPVHRMIFVNRWLQAHGYLTLAKNINNGWETAFSRMGLTPALIKEWLKRADVLGLRHHLSRDTRQRLRETVDQAFQSNLNLRKTRAYACTNADQGIYVNRRSASNPVGQHLASEAYEQLRDELIDGLRKLADPITGQPVFEWAVRREDIYNGERVSKAPDVLLRPAQGYLLNTDIGGKDQNAVAPCVGVEITGFHRPDGVFLAYGPDFRSGQVENAHIVDLVPTMLHALGLPVPSHLDGQVLDIAAPSKARQVSYEEIELETSGADAVAYSGEEEAEIMDRLRDLGYL